jgi:hypothetical protein
MIGKLSEIVKWNSGARIIADELLEVSHGTCVFKSARRRALVREL